MRTLPNILDTPMYDTAFVARLTKLSPSRVRRWLRGYQYPLADGNGEVVVVRQKPLVYRKGASDAIYASFLDVIDLLFIKEFLKEGISIQTLRKAFDEAKKLTNKHHFAHSTFFTKGRTIYMQVKDKSEGLIQLFTNGQWVIEPFVKQFGKRIDFDKVSKYALRWKPLVDNDKVVIDPRVCFGSPFIDGRGITTRTIYDFYLAENKRTESVVDWYDLEVPEVKAAVNFERWLIKKAA